MAYREVRMVEVREVLRLWLRGEGLRSVAGWVSLDRKTVRRYVEAAREAGLDGDGGEEQLSDELLADVVARVRPKRPQGRGPAWQRCEAHRGLLAKWLRKDLTVVKCHQLLERRGEQVPLRTLYRFCVEELGYRRPPSTVPVADGEPGRELQADFGRLGLIRDPEQGRRRVVRALVLVAVFSRHLFVWPTHGETTEELIAGFEQAWAFFGGVFSVVIPDNTSAIVAEADAVNPRLSEAFLDYAAARGFVVDPARVGKPTDKPRVERAVPYVRNNFFAGEDFAGLDDVRRRGEHWALHVAGQRIHGTTRRRPAEVFAAEEQPALAPPPAERYEVPIYRRAKVHRDHHIEVAKALYSVPDGLIGERVDVRADSQLVRISHRGQHVKTHPRQPAGSRSTDADDLPSAESTYALRDLDTLQAKAASYGASIGAYTTALLDVPLPWTRMRSVYRLLGLVRRYGADRVEAACQKALATEVVSVGLIERMVERAAEAGQTEPPPAQPAGRFARDPSEFTPTTHRRHGADEGDGGDGQEVAG
jgi:hypothetical protein